MRWSTVWSVCLIALTVMPMGQALLVSDAPEVAAADEPEQAPVPYAAFPSDILTWPAAPRMTPMQAPGDQQLEFICPGRNDGDIVLGSVATTTMVYTCPRRIYDFVIGGNEGYLMGNMKMHVNPDDPEQMALFTLHGDATENGPTTTSRRQYTHSTYPSTDMGNTFDDEWTDGNNNGGGFGEEAAGVLDPEGHMYVAYTWADGFEDDYDYTLYVYKGDTVAQEHEQLMQTYNTGNRYDIRTDHAITEPSLVFYPKPSPPSNETGNESMTPGEYGEFTQNISKDGLVVLSFHVAAQGGFSNVTGKSAWVDMHWTNATGSNRISDWQWLDTDQLIGPCRDASNAVVWDERVYVACTVDRGYDARSRAKVGQVDLWSMDPRTGETRHESYTGISGDHPRLAVNSNGYFAVVTTRVDEGRVDVHASLGWHGTHWNRQHSMGRLLHQEMGGYPVNDAHVTAIAVSDTENTVFAIYQEWNDISGIEPSTNPDAVDPRAKEYSKFVFTFNECVNPIAGAHFGLGDFLVQANGDAYQERNAEEYPGVFSDLSDGLQIVTMPNGEEYAWFAVGDYGAAQLGAIRVASGLDDQVCAFAPVPITPPPVPIPAAATLANPYSMATASGVIVAGLSMVGYLSFVKRRSPAFSAAQSKK